MTALFIWMGIAGCGWVMALWALLDCRKAKGWAVRAEHSAEAADKGFRRMAAENNEMRDELRRQEEWISRIRSDLARAKDQLDRVRSALEF